MNRIEQLKWFKKENYLIFAFDSTYEKSLGAVFLNSKKKNKIFLRWERPLSINAKKP